VGNFILIARTVLFTFLAIQVSYVIGQMLIVDRYFQGFWILPMFMSLGLKVVYPPDSPIRILFALVFLFCAGIYLSTVSERRVPLIWYLCVLGLLASWIIALILGFALNISFQLFSLISLAVATGYPFFLLVMSYRRTGSSAVLIFLVLLLLWTLSGFWDFTLGAMSGPFADTGLWLSLILNFGTGAYLFRNVFLNAHSTWKIDGDVLRSRDFSTDTLVRIGRSELNHLLLEKFTAPGIVATGLVHEFKNLISHIRLSAEYGLAKSDRKAKDRSLSAVLDHSEMGMKSVSALLDGFATAGSIAQFRLRLKERLPFIVRILQSSYRNEGIHFKLNIDGEPRLSIPKGELEQALLNLMRNSIDAFKHHPANREKRVSLKAWVEEPHSIIELKDNAGGIPEEVQAVLFDPPSASNPKGLGLYLAFITVTRNGGELQYQPMTDGSCFRIILPME